MEVILQILLLLLLAKIFGELVEQTGYPALIGEIAAGFLLGPGLLNLVIPGPTIEIFADIGLISLIFISGVDMDLRLFVRSEKVAAFTAMAGVLVPLCAGILLGALLHLPPIQSLFLGIALTATSIGISVRTLVDFKKLNTSIGTTIVGAAVFDDIIGIFLLALLAALAAGGTALSDELFPTLLLGAAFLLVMATAGKRAITWVFEKARRTQTHEMVFSITLIIALGIAYAAHGAGLHFAIGAFIAGIILGESIRSDRVLFDSLSDFGFGFFVTLFFAFIGLLFTLDMETLTSPFLLPIIGLAFGGKILGGFLGSAPFLGKKAALSVGIGMCPRGEITLIIAKVALVGGMITGALYSGITLMVIVSILLTPGLLLKSFPPTEPSSPPGTR
ncbi:MAG: cation:proton antiporter [Methanomicrobiaceae archaeon]|nr:cation:proton antiporter [Methanomicrobiaceae archaeon]